MKRSVLVFLGVVLLLALAFAAYVRLAPSDPARWHVAVEGAADRDFAGGALRVVEGGAARLSQIDGAMRGLARTQVLTGSVAEGRVSYVTRSKWMGFPDYTTVEAREGQVAIYARLRFGKSDLGVNRARVEGVLGGG